MKKLLRNRGLVERGVSFRKGAGFQIVVINRSILSCGLLFTRK